MTSILFVCVENSNRSQMAETFARKHTAATITAASAGSRPARNVSPKAVAAMAEIGCDLSSKKPKSFAELVFQDWDYIVTMGCGDECPNIPAKNDWIGICRIPRI